MMPEPILQMKGITKRFGPVTALENVNFDLFEGEVLALIGENGAGKSTLMKILGGVHQPTEGYLTVDGKKAVLTDVFGIDDLPYKTTLASGEYAISIYQDLNLNKNFDKKQ